MKKFKAEMASAALFSEVLKNKHLNLAFLGALLLHFSLNLLGFPHWDCPLLKATNHPI